MQLLWVVFEKSGQVHFQALARSIDTRVC
jgi:hypothetical protein